MLRRRMSEDDPRRAGHAGRGCLVGMGFAVVYVVWGLLTLAVFAVPAYLLTR